MEHSPEGVPRTADAVIAGGGIAGLAVARALAGRGVRRVAVFDRARLGGEASLAAAGMLAVQSEASREDAFFRLACASRDLYPEFGEALREETRIDIELDRTGTLYLAFTEKDEQEAAARYEWQSRAGLNVGRLTASEAREIEPCISPHARAVLRFPLDWQVENRRLVAALAASAERRGVGLFPGIEVESLVIERGRVEGVRTALGTVHSGTVIVAGGAWTSRLLEAGGASLQPLGVEPVRGQMLCFETARRLTNHVLYSPRGYLVPRLDGRVLAGSTTERTGFDKRVTASGLNAITKSVMEIAPAVGGLGLVNAWAGLRPRAADGQPVLGATAEIPGLFFATGHYRNGILLAPVTGELVAEEVTTGRRSSLIEDFTPDRFAYTGVN